MKNLSTQIQLLVPTLLILAGCVGANKGLSIQDQIEEQTRLDEMAAASTVENMKADGFTVIDDMIFSPDETTVSGEVGAEKTQHSADRRLFWPNNIIPIAFESNIPQHLRDIFWSAVIDWNNQPKGVKFVMRTSENYQLLVKYGPDGSGCNSTVGYFVSNNYKPRINLEGACWDRQVILHELGHALGLQHEHQRPDRDKYITIKDHARNNPSLSIVSSTLINTPYDPTSAMHYCFDPREDFFFLKPGVTYDAFVKMEDQCMLQNNYKLSFWDRRASEEIYYLVRKEKPPAVVYPSPSRFDEGVYLARYPDVADHVRRGLLPSGEYHYANWGAREGRRTNFNEENYLMKYADVADHVRRGLLPNGRYHYVGWGAKEGRSD